MHVIIASVVSELQNLKLINISEKDASEVLKKKEPIEQDVDVWYWRYKQIWPLETKTGNTKKWKQSYFSSSSF